MYRTVFQIQFVGHDATVVWCRNTWAEKGACIRYSVSGQMPNRLRAPLLFGDDGRESDWSGNSYEWTSSTTPVTKEFLSYRNDTQLHFSVIHVSVNVLQPEKARMGRDSPKKSLPLPRENAE
jgi:hypothetical protein